MLPIIFPFLLPAKLILDDHCDLEGLAMGELATDMLLRSMSITFKPDSQPIAPSELLLEPSDPRGHSGVLHLSAPYLRLMPHSVTSSSVSRS